jgi:apolipoprotein N-acyltransferase
VTLVGGTNVTIARVAHATMLSFGWRRAAIAVAAGAVSVLTLPPFGLWPVGFLTFPFLIWLIDGAAAGPPPSSAGGSASAIFSAGSTGSATLS